MLLFIPACEGNSDHTSEFGRVLLRAVWEGSPTSVPPVVRTVEVRIETAGRTVRRLANPPGQGALLVDGLDPGSADVRILGYAEEVSDPAALRLPPAFASAVATVDIRLGAQVDAGVVPVLAQPFLSAVSPLPDATDVPPQTSVSFVLASAVAEIDRSSIDIAVGGQQLVITGTPLAGASLVACDDGGGNPCGAPLRGLRGYAFTTAGGAVPANSDVIVVVRARDTSEAVRTLDFTYAFHTGGAAATPTVTRTASVTSPPSATPTASATATLSVPDTALPTATATPTASATVTDTATPTLTPTATPSDSPTATPTLTATASLTATPPPTQTPSASATPASSATSTVTSTATRTATPSPTASPTATATPTHSPSATPSPSASSTATPTATPSRSATATATPTATRTVTATATPTATATATVTATATPSVAPTAEPTATGTASPTTTATPTAPPTATPSVTATVEPSATATPTPSFTATASPTASDTATVTATRTATPTATPTGTPTASPSPTPSPTPTSLTPFDGKWSGTSSQNRSLSFTVVNNAVTEASVRYRIEGPLCSIDSLTTTSFSPPRPIVGGSFTATVSGGGVSGVSFTMQGTFSSASSATGTLNFTFRQTRPLTPCTVIVSATWTAAKQQVAAGTP